MVEWTYSVDGDGSSRGVPFAVVQQYLPVWSLASVDTDCKDSVLTVLFLVAGRCNQ